MRGVARSIAAVLSLAVVLPACSDGDETNVAALCSAVDEIVEAVTRLLAPDVDTMDPGDLAEEYAGLADLNRGVAGALAASAAAGHAEQFADVLERASEAVAGADPDRLLEELQASEEIAEMSAMVNENLPLGLNEAAMDEIEEHCDPDLSSLQPTGSDGDAAESDASAPEPEPAPDADERG